MQELLSLLERKNLCFRSFNKLCFDFIAEIAQGDTARLDDFQRKRESLIKVLEQLEFEVSNNLRELGPTFVPTPADKASIARLLHEKDGFVRSILDLDLQILGHIDRLKNETIQKLQSLRSGQKAVSGYRSPIDSVEAASGNKIVDQEA